MKIFKNALPVIIPLALFALALAPAQAYFVQPRSSHTISGYAHPRYSYPYGYGYRDEVSQIIRGHLNFVDYYTYVPSPVRPYFYYHYYPYFGW